MLTRLRRLAIARGLGRSNAWLAVGAAAWALDFLKRKSTKEPKVVFRQKLKPGEGLLISHLPPDA